MTENLVPPRWQPLPPVERRVLGVLIEKAKTTPDNYPLSLVALCNGCNQKSNRDPQMSLHEDEVQTALEHLRERGAVVFVEGSGRVEKYRHLAYEWLGVNKAELAVMCELLLRGPQTEGQLRAHVERMEPMPDLAALRLVLADLKARRLVLPLTSEGRGHVVCHALYPAEELAQLRAHYGAAGAGSASEAASETAAARPQAVAATAPEPISQVPPHERAPEPAASAEIAQLASELAALRVDVDNLRATCHRIQGVLERLCSALGVDRY